MRQVNLKNVGTLPDFGNFCLTHPWGTTGEGCKDIYDRYKGIQELLPFANGISAKTYDFNEQGEHSQIGYASLMNLVKSSGFEGYIGVEFEGKTPPEEEGIRKNKEFDSEVPIILVYPAADKITLKNPGRSLF